MLLTAVPKGAREYPTRSLRSEKYAMVNGKTSLAAWLLAQNVEVSLIDTL